MRVRGRRRRDEEEDRSSPEIGSLLLGADETDRDEGDARNKRRASPFLLGVLLEARLAVLDVCGREPVVLLAAPPLLGVPSLWRKFFIPFPLERSRYLVQGSCAFIFWYSKLLAPLSIFFLYSKGTVSLFSRTCGPVRGGVRTDEGQFLSRTRGHFRVFVVRFRKTLGAIQNCDRRSPSVMSM